MNKNFLEIEKGRFRKITDRTETEISNQQDANQTTILRDKETVSLVPKSLHHRCSC